ncbi:hypothetical protein Bbelb_036860 [Branchiostoma belcheri]|nr:hypothetical protein Bbelb_036860 [Branchiostoma belcheri]
MRPVLSSVEHKCTIKVFIIIAGMSANNSPPGRTGSTFHKRIETGYEVPKPKAKAIRKNKATHGNDPTVRWKELSHGGSLGIGPSIINPFPGQSASPSMISFPGSSTSVVPYCDLGVVLHKSLQRLREFLKALRKVRHVRWNMETPDIWGTLDERPVCFLVETHWVYTALSCSAPVEVYSARVKSRALAILPLVCWQCGETDTLPIPPEKLQCFRAFIQCARCFTKPLSTTSSSVTAEVHKFCLETPIEEATTPPASWYTDERLHDLEMRTVFRRNWVAVGVTNQVARPGQFFTGTIFAVRKVFSTKDSTHGYPIFAVQKVFSTKDSTHRYPIFAVQKVFSTKDSIHRYPIFAVQTVFSTKDSIHRYPIFAVQKVFSTKDSIHRYPIFAVQTVFSTKDRVLGADPFVVVRDQSDQLRAFHNVCRHRANIVVRQEEGRTDQFTCCYHGWTYRLDGRLSKALRLRGIKNFSARENGLKPVAVRTWGPAVLVRLEGEGRADFQEKTSPLLHYLDSQGFTQGMTHICRRYYDTRCNWKLLVENAQDHNSHVEYVHKDLAKIVDLPSTKVEATELYSKMTGQGAKENDQSTEGQRYGEGYTVANIFPNLAVNRYGPWLDTNLLLPLAADRTRIVMDYFLEEDFIKNTSEKELADFIETSLKDSDQVQKEDNDICESVQRGLLSSAYDVGRYLPMIEHGPHMFHVFLGTELRKGLELGQNF